MPVAYVVTVVHDVQTMAKEHAGFRVEPELLERLDVIAAELSKRAAGVEAKRGDVARAALARGIESLEIELGIATKKRSKAANSPRSK